MTPAQRIMLTTRKKRKRQLIFKGISAFYTISLTVLFFYIILQFGFPPKTNAEAPTPTPSIEPAPDRDELTESTDVLPQTPNIHDKLIALTFDDGPSNYTTYLLDALEEHDAKATFFIIGDRLNNYRDTIKRMDYLGMEIGSHTFHHDLLTKLDQAGIEDTMKQTDEALTQLIGHGASLMRPVEGAVNDLVQSTVNKPIIRWNVDTVDWKTRDAQAIVDHVLQNVSDGCIILMHDIYPTTIEAAKILIPKLQEMGYQLVTVTELAQARNVELLPGEIYRNFPSLEQKLSKIIE